MNQSEFRHNFINPISILVDIRKNLVDRQKKYCRAMNCHEARNAVKQIIIIDKKIIVMLGKIEMDVLNVLPEVCDDSIIKRCEGANDERNNVS